MIVYDWMNPTSTWPTHTFPASDEGLANFIAGGIEARGYTAERSFGRTKNDYVVACQLTPNSRFEFGCGRGRPVAYRYKNGPDTDADKYFSETVEEFFNSFRRAMAYQAYEEGWQDFRMTGTSDGRKYQTRWAKTQWESYYYEGYGRKPITI